MIRLYRTMDQELGKLRGLVNNAGILLELGPIEKVGEDMLNHLWAVNITSAFLCAREAVARMSTDQGGPGGAIVNISSVASKLGGGMHIEYAASKGALEALDHGLAQEVAGQGIRVNGVRPGLSATEIHASAGAPGRVEELGPSVPMGRAGSAEEVAETVLWLLSEQASYVTDSLVEVSGGR